MQLNTIKPAAGAKRERRRVGRGIGSGLGKTAGRGHKGQKSRAGGYHKVGFEGGQMPLQRRIPKRGFKSRAKGQSMHLTLDLLEHYVSVLGLAELDLLALKTKGLAGQQVKTLKIIATGKLDSPVKLTGVAASAKARAAIEAAGGSLS